MNEKHWQRIMQCKCIFDARKHNSHYNLNNNLNNYVCVKDFIWNPSICTWEIGKYLKHNVAD